jgi:membrane-associated phospholipid phosphatase
LSHDRHPPRTHLARRLLPNARRFFREAPPAVPAGLRRPAGLACLLGAGLVTLLGLRYAGESDAARVDAKVRDAVDRIPAGRGGLADTLFSFGDPRSVATAASALAVVALILRRPRMAVVAIAGPILTGVTTVVLKPLVGRTFDDNGGLAFPSGHTGGITSITLVVGLIVVGMFSNASHRHVLMLCAALLAVGGLTTVALTAIDLHYPTDVVGGFGTAVAMVLSTALLVDRLWSHWVQRA